MLCGYAKVARRSGVAAFCLLQKAKHQTDMKMIHSLSPRIQYKIPVFSSIVPTGTPEEDGRGGKCGFWVRSLPMTPAGPVRGNGCTFDIEARRTNTYEVLFVEDQMKMCRRKGSSAAGKRFKSRNGRGGYFCRWAHDLRVI